MPSPVRDWRRGHRKEQPNVRTCSYCNARLTPTQSCGCRMTGYCHDHHLQPVQAMSPTKDKCRVSETQFMSCTLSCGDRVTLVLPIYHIDQWHRARSLKWSA